MGWVLLSPQQIGHGILHFSHRRSRDYSWKAVFQLWFLGRKNHRGQLFPLVITSMCLF